MIVDCAVYEAGKRREGETSLADASQLCRRDGSFAWLGLHEPSEEEFEAVRAEFGLHPLAVEDAIHAHQRPKLEVYHEMVFLVLKTARYVDPTEVIELGEVLVFLGEDFIITVRHGEASSLTRVRERLDADPRRLKHGPSSALHAILDQIVDDYQPAMEGLETDIDEVEEQLFSGERVNPAERIYRLQREVLGFRKATAPLVDPIDKLARGHYAQIHPEIRDYFRDVNDHLIRVREQLDAMRDLLSGSLQANLAQVAVRQNDDVRMISAWVAIIAVPTAIAGIYGMNFDPDSSPFNMPELGWFWGYPSVIVLMLLVGGGMAYYFKRKGWF